VGFGGRKKEEVKYYSAHPTGLKVPTEHGYKVLQLRARKERLIELACAIISTLDERFEYVFQIVTIKAGAGLATYDPNRERKLLARIKKSSKGLIPSVSAENIWQEIMTQAKAWQDQIRDSLNSIPVENPTAELDRYRKQLDIADANLIDYLAE